MKRSVALLILLSLTIYSFTVSFAGDNISIESPNLEYNEKTEFDEIWKSENGEYAEVLNQGRLIIPVGRYDIPLFDDEALLFFVEKTSVMNDTKEHVLAQIKELRALNTNDDSITLSIFSQDLLGSNLSGDTEYHTYLGCSMKSDFVYLYNIYSQYNSVASGIGAKTVAAAVNEVIFYVGSQAIEQINFLQSFLSIFETAANATVVSTSIRDYSEISFRYNKATQLTYADDGISGWELGCETSKINLFETHERQFFVVRNVGHLENTVQITTKTIKSGIYDDPWSTAFIYRGNPLVLNNKYKVASRIYVFD